MYHASTTSVVILLGIILQVSCLVDEKRLHTDLLASYNKEVRPILNQTGAVQVQFGLALIDFNLDAETDILDCLFWIRMKWTDEYLRWSPEEYGGVTVTRFGQEDIWRPDMFLYNSWDPVSVQQSASQGSYPLVVSTGAVLWVPAVRLRSRCSIDRSNWPREQALCYLKFGSWTHHGFSLNLSLYATSPDMDLTDYIGSQRWAVENTSAQLVNKRYSCCDEPYPSIEYNMTLRRHDVGTAQLKIPVIVSTGLMMLSFLVPMDHPQKMTLGCVSLVVSLLAMMNLYNNLTEQAHGQAAIATFYYSFCIVLLLFYILEVLLTRLARVHTSLPMPKFVRSVLSGVLGKMLCLDSPVFQNYSQEDNEMLDQPQPEDGDFSQTSTARIRRRADPGSVAAEWSLLAVALDRILFVVFAVVMILMVPPNITWMK